MIDKLVDAGGSASSYKEAARLVHKQAGIKVSPAQIARLVQQIGDELWQRGAAEAALHQRRELPAPADQPPVEIACVQIDGGRILTRAAEQGRGVHEQAWKESKVAALWKMAGPEFDHDPHPEPPQCFRDPAHVRQLANSLKSQRELHPDEPLSSPPDDVPPAPQPRPDAPRQWPPERVYRTCVGTLSDVYGFGPLVAAEAQRRGFFQADRQVFLGDGDQKNWTVHKLHFPQFTAITDFVHPVSYLYQSAGAVTCSFAAQWEQYTAWLTEVWQGRVTHIIGELEAWAERLGPPPAEAAEDDPREIVARALTYLKHNASRMNYAEYRRRGLPITSCLVESLIKEFNRRVKGTEKFWSRPDGAEAILHVRAALLSDGDPLSRYIHSRPGRLHYRRTPATSPIPPNSRRQRK